MLFASGALGHVVRWEEISWTGVYKGENSDLFSLEARGVFPALLLFPYEER